ncbi:unnamed protein product, partial [Ectocarpus sp. 8 AP-2014]
GFSVDTSPEDPERAHMRDGKQAEDRGQQVSRPEPGVVADVSDFCSWQELVLDFVTGTPSPPSPSSFGNGTPHPVVGNLLLQDKDDHVADDDAASLTRDDVDDAAAAEAGLVTSVVSPEGPETVDWPDGKQGQDRGQVSRAEKDVVADVTDCCSWKEVVLDLVTGTPSPPPSSSLGKGAPQPVMVNTFRQDKDDDPPDDATAPVDQHHVGDAAASDAAAAEAALLPSRISPEPTGTGFSISPFTWDPESASLSYAQSVSQTDDRGQQLPRVEPNGVAHEADCCSW